MNQPIPHPTVTAPASELIERLNWRYAAKKMDPAKAVPQDKVERILEAARLAPTSSGLQPYEIFVVTDPAVRARIQPIARNQAQITRRREKPRPSGRGGRAQARAASHWLGG